MRRHDATDQPCEHCGRVTGSLWVTYANVIDPGVPSMPPIEPNMMELRRCDDCELLDRLADPRYRELCFPVAGQMERDALARGGRPPSPKSN